MAARRAQVEEETLALATAMRQRLLGVSGQIRGDLDALDGIDGQIDKNSDFLEQQQRKIDERLANQVRWVVVVVVVVAVAPAPAVAAAAAAVVVAAAAAVVVAVVSRVGGCRCRCVSLVRPAVDLLVLRVRAGPASLPLLLARVLLVLGGVICAALPAVICSWAFASSSSGW
jgi:hypothetical protein